MPETAVDEHDRPVPGQNDVGRSGQVTPVQPEPVPEAVEQSADPHLRRRVPAADRSHVATALRSDGPGQGRCGVTHPGEVA